MKPIFSIKINPYQFSATILTLMLALFLVAIFTGLGRWQLDRMHEKHMIETQYQERSTQTYQALPIKINNPEKWRYKKVYVEGKWIKGKQFLLDNQVRNRQAGYNVFTLFETTDNQYILIDRGWVPLVNASREVLPDISFTPTSGSQKQKVEGHLYVPFSSSVTTDKKWFQVTSSPILIPELDFAIIEAMLGISIEKYVIRMSPENKFGYLRTWKSIAFSSDKHLGYAIQWFALAITIFILLVAVNTKRIKQ